MEKESNTKPVLNTDDEALLILKSINETDDIIKENLEIKKKYKKLVDKLNAEQDKTERLTENIQKFQPLKKTLKKYKLKIDSLGEFNENLNANLKKRRFSNILKTLLSSSIILLSLTGLIFLYRSTSIEELENEIEYLQDKTLSVEAKVTGLYLDENNTYVLKYLNRKNKIWKVKDYNLLTNDNIKLGDNIRVDYKKKYSKIEFVKISLKR